MEQIFSIRIRDSYSDNRKSVLSPSTPFRINAVEGSKTCTAPGRSIQNLKSVALVAIAVTFAMCGAVAQAQPEVKIPKIGWLGARSASGPGGGPGTGAESFRREFSKLGYVEGKNVTFEYRFADNKLDRLPALAEELVRLKVDVLVAGATNEALAAKNATRTIPIVFFGAGDPIAAGLVDSLARPGGNLTGFTNIGAVLAGKRLELLKETVPKLSRVAMLWNPQDPSSGELWKESLHPARELDLQLYSMEVSSANNFEKAFNEATKTGCSALAVGSGPLFISNQKTIANLAAKSRLPAIYIRADYVEIGGLMSYGPDGAEPYRRAAVFVDKILKGAKPADLPVEQPKKFELIINLKTAKQIGLTFPPNVLARADRVVK